MFSLAFCISCVCMSGTLMLPQEVMWVRPPPASESRSHRNIERTNLSLDKIFLCVDVAIFRMKHR